MSELLSDFKVKNSFYQDYYTKLFSLEKNKFDVLNFAFQFTHKTLEKNHNKSNQTVLEIGAGYSEHLSFVKPNFKKYIMIDKKKPRTIAI